MSSFPNLTGNQISGLIEFLANGESKELASSEPASPLMKYHLTGYKRFLDPDGYPAVAPPWGTLNAINLNTGEFVWKIPFGEYPELAAQGMKNTGTENYGGPIVTAGGLLFIGATQLRQKIPRLRQIHRRTTLGNHPAFRRKRHPRQLPNQRPPIRGNSRRRRQRPEIPIRWNSTKPLLCPNRNPSSPFSRMEWPIFSPASRGSATKRSHQRRCSSCWKSDQR